MKFKLLLVIATLLLPLAGNAAGDSYWAIGSFESKLHAMQEVTRIQQLIQLEIQVVQTTVHGRKYYRLLTLRPESAASRERTRVTLADAGVTGIWTLPMDEQATIPRMVTADHSDQIAASTAPAAPSAAPSAPTNSELPFTADKDSYYDFCMNRATAAQREQYCGNHSFSERSRQKLSRKTASDESYRILMNYCIRKATPNERLRKCRNAGLEKAAN